MKKLLKVALVAVCIVFAGNVAKAQTKIGYINFDQLVDQLPETKVIRTQLETYNKQFQDQYTAMTSEYQTKGQAYEAQRAHYRKTAHRCPVLFVQSFPEFGQL